MKITKARSDPNTDGKVAWRTFTILTSEPGSFAVVTNNGRRVCVKAKGLK